MKTNMEPLGVILFSIYLLLYGGFVLTTAFFPQAMQQMAIGNVNVAVVYGIGLIIAAFVLALIYGIRGKTAANDSGGEKQS